MLRCADFSRQDRACLPLPIGSGRSSTSSRAHAFKLTKWYFDCAGDDGRTAIGYWASLAWRGLSLTWQSIAVCETGRAPTERWSLAGGAAPTRERDRIVWPATALGCTFAADSCHP